jgi:PTS system beta-glucosides-specific IIC component
VKKGDLLVEADVEAIKAEGYDVITPVLVSNTDAFASVEGFAGKEVNLGDAIIKVTK